MMNGNGGRNQPFVPNQPYVPNRRQNVHILFSLKIHFQQRIALMFGADRLAEVNASTEPFILPLVNHHNSFDVLIFILF